MATEIQVDTVVLPGGKIEISSHKLIAGRKATVVVVVENNEDATQPHVIDILAALPGHRLFQSAEQEQRKNTGISDSSGRNHEH